MDDDKLLELELIDTNGLEEYEPVRATLYPEAHVILLCFSITWPQSLKHVSENVSNLESSRLRMCAHAS